MKILLACALFPSLTCAELLEKTIAYEHQGVVLEGFHVYDDAIQGQRPGVMIVHQWTGLGDHEKERGRRLAKLGYNVFAADVYGKGVRPEAPEAGKEAGKYKKDRDLYRARLSAGLDVLKNDKRTNAEKLGAIGFCFGGTGVLEMARAGMDLDGVVSFHGGLAAAKGKEAKKGEVAVSVLACSGALDPHVKQDEVIAFTKEMSAADVDWELNVYSGAVHSFTQKSAGDDPSNGSAYNKKADERSWEAMKDFFAEVFAD